MPIQQLDTFTDRREALALFDVVRGRDPAKPWPLLPILAFIAPGGSGKSTLLDYLRLKQCSSAGRAALPYAHLDFTLPSAPKDLLSILIALRDQLQQHADGPAGLAKHLTFPRFDLGALVTLATSSTDDFSTLGPQEVRRKLAAGKQIFEGLKDLGSSLGFAVPFVPPLLAGLNLAGRIPAIKYILSYLEDRTGWQWYRRQGTVMGLGAEAGMKDVLLRLYLLSRPGTPEREQLVNDVLPAAFAADLYSAIVEADPPQAWTKTANVVVFLDGFEALQHASSETATRLLQVLSIEPRKQGRTDPVLLVVGSRNPLADLPAEEASVPFARTQIHDNATMQRHMSELYTHLQQLLPADTRFLRIKDLYLPLWLHDFGPEDTRSYLLRFGEKEHTQIFVEQSELVQTIDRVTRGHPLFLALAAEAAFEAEVRGRALTAADFEQAEVSARIAPVHEAEQIADYLLELFLRQFSETERKELVFCAIPRVLNAAVLHVLLPSLDDLDVQQRWQTYRRLSFVSAIDEQRSVLHPLVRRLLLRRLPVRSDLASDYVRTHSQLRSYFEEQAGNGEEQAQIEAVYHALALGDADPAIGMGVQAQQSRLALWQPLMEAVIQAPTDKLPNTTEARAEETLMLASHQHEVQPTVTAIVLYTWLLSTSQDDQEQAARLQNNLGNAYWSLPGGDRTANLEQAIACYQATLQVYTRETYPDDWARTQQNLGNAYAQLPSRDRTANLKQAIAYYEAALLIQTREALPFDWAATQHSLGNAYAELPGEDRTANLKQAIACYEAALLIQTREAFPVDWAATQHNLGLTYAELPGGDQAANLKQAIACYKATLQVYTRETFPNDWAMVHRTMGLTYWRLPDGDRAANLKHAITCYEAALQVYTREAFPNDWAILQCTMGDAYAELPGGDRAANLKQAIACYKAALQIFSLTHMDDYSEVVSNDLEVLQEALQQLEQSNSMQ